MHSLKMTCNSLGSCQEDATPFLSGTNAPRGNYLTLRFLKIFVICQEFQNKKLGFCLNKVFNSKVRFGIFQLSKRICNDFMLQSQTFELGLETVTNIEKYFIHEIKINRVKKELISLYNTDFPGIQLDQARYSSIALIIPFKYFTQSKKLSFEFRLDFEYPFNRPQIWLVDKNSLSAEGRDLMYYLLKEDQKWGPSMLISSFLERIPELVQKIIQNTTEIMGRYYEFQSYGVDELKEKGLKFYKAKQTHRKMLLKKTTDKMIALSSCCFLKFSIKNNSLYLEFWSPFKNIRQIISNVEKGDLTIGYIGNSKNMKFILHNVEKIEQILSVLNPIQMIERRVKTCQETQSVVTDQLIKDYGQLTAYYSAHDNQEKANMFMKKMKSAINQSYNKTDDKK